MKPDFFQQQTCSEMRFALVQQIHISALQMSKMKLKNVLNGLFSDTNQNASSIAQENLLDILNVFLSVLCALAI